MPDSRIINTRTEIVAADALRVHPQNPREGDLGAIMESIRVNGFYGVLVVQRSTTHILAGNHRYMAGCQLGMTEFPVVWLDVDDASALRIVLADNRTSDLALNNIDVLVHHLTQIMQNTGSLEGTGYDGDDLDTMLKDLDKSLDFGATGADDESGALGHKYEVVVECASEQEQTALIDRLQGEGHLCRALVS